jgi:hypothetical protein
MSGVVSLVAYSMVAVVLHRLILFDDRKSGTLLLFSLKRTEWLFIGFAVLIWIAVLVAAVAIGAIGALTSAVGSAIPIVLGVVALLAGIYLWTRLMPLYPVIVVEKRLDFRAAFDLSRGNFWRLFGVSALGMLPVAIVFFIVFSAHAFFALRGLNELASSSSDPVRTVADAIERYLLQMSIGSFVASVIGTGLGIPLICYSYKALRNIGPFEYLEESG